MENRENDRKNDHEIEKKDHEIEKKDRQIDETATRPLILPLSVSVCE